MWTRTAAGLLAGICCMALVQEGATQEPDWLVDVELQFIAVDASAVRKMLEKDGAFTTHHLLTLRDKGAFEMLHPPLRVRTRIGVQATVKAVRERIYPTSFGAPATIGGVAATNIAVGASVVPTGFRERDVGSSLTVLPEVGRGGGTVNLTLRCELVVEEEVHEHEGYLATPDSELHEIHLEQPLFQTFSLATDVVARSGQAVIAGGQSIGEGRRVLYMVVTAWAYDMAAPQ